MMDVQIGKFGSCTRPIALQSKECLILFTARPQTALHSTLGTPCFLFLLLKHHLEVSIQADSQVSSSIEDYLFHTIHFTLYCKIS